jgi:hypothetical protein
MLRIYQIAPARGVAEKVPEKRKDQAAGRLAITQPLS